MCGLYDDQSTLAEPLLVCLCVSKRRGSQPRGCSIGRLLNHRAKFIEVSPKPVSPVVWLAGQQGCGFADPAGAETMFFLGSDLCTFNHRATYVPRCVALAAKPAEAAWLWSREGVAYRCSIRTYSSRMARFVRKIRPIT